MKVRAGIKVWSCSHYILEKFQESGPQINVVLYDRHFITTHLKCKQFLKNISLVPVSIIQNFKEVDQTVLKTKLV